MTDTFQVRVSFCFVVLTSQKRQGDYIFCGLTDFLYVTYLHDHIKVFKSLFENTYLPHCTLPTFEKFFSGTLSTRALAKEYFLH